MNGECERGGGWVGIKCECILLKLLWITHLHNRQIGTKSKLKVAQPSIDNYKVFSHVFFIETVLIRFSERKTIKLTKKKTRKRTIKTRTHRHWLHFCLFLSQFSINGTEQQLSKLHWNFSFYRNSNTTDCNAKITIGFNDKIRRDKETILFQTNRPTQPGFCFRFFQSLLRCTKL